MKLDTQEFLDLVEDSRKLAFFDIEATGLKGDYNSILCISVRPVGLNPQSFAIEVPGRDKRVVEQAAKYLEQFTCWVSYYGKGFDIPMINTRLLKWGLEPVKPKPHIDLYFTLRSHLNTARRSQAHLLEWLRIKKSGTTTENEDEQIHKMTVSADEWNEVLADPKRVMKTMVARCESDTLGLEALYHRTKHLIRDVRS